MKFLTFCILLVNLAVAECASSNSASLKRKGIMLLLPSAVFIGLYAYGAAALNTYSSTDGTEKVLRISAVQGATHFEEKRLAHAGDKAAQQRVVAQYLNLSAEAISLSSKTDIVVWPETAFPVPFSPRPSPAAAPLHALIIDFVNSSGTQLVFGAGDYKPSERLLFNAIHVIQPNGTNQVYRKNILIPFGEYVPLIGSIPPFAKYFNKQFARADVMRPLEFSTAVGRLRAIPVLCYEGLFLSHIIRGLKQGGEFILNLTDDTWFQSEVEARLHLNAAAFSSVETRLPQIRVNNSGVSALITPTGELVNALPYGSKAIHNYEMKIGKRPQGMLLKWGDWFPSAAAIAFAIIVAMAAAIKKRA